MDWVTGNIVLPVLRASFARSKSLLAIGSLRSMCGLLPRKGEIVLSSDTQELESTRMNSTRIIAIDLAKNVFQVCLFDHYGKVLSNKTVRRAGLAKLLAKQSPALVAMEACGGAHHWGRKAQSLGHQVMIIPPKQVTPYRQGQKTDSNDALAIGIAANQADLKTVGVKSLD